MTPQHVVGAQLYTVREHCKDLEGLRQSLRKIADIGYTAVQVSGVGPIEPQAIADAAQETGLKIVATHSGWNRFLNDLDALIAEHKTFRCRHLAVGMLPKEYHSLEGLKRFEEEVIPVSERLAAEGMTFSYHNHSHEFVRYGGKTWLEMLYEDVASSHVKAELDTYWVQHGGGDPVQWICRCAGRQPVLHLKDMAVTEERQQRFAEVGEGNLNWNAILQAARESGVDWFMVEQDQTYGRDPFESLAISYRNLTALGLS